MSEVSGHVQEEDDTWYSISINNQSIFILVLICLILLLSITITLCISHHLRCWDVINNRNDNGRKRQTNDKREHETKHTQTGPQNVRHISYFD